MALELKYDVSFHDYYRNFNAILTTTDVLVFTKLMRAALGGYKNAADD